MTAQNTIDSGTVAKKGLATFYKSSLWVKLTFWFFGCALTIGVISQGYIALVKPSETPLPSSTIQSKSFEFQSRGMQAPQPEANHEVLSKSFDLSELNSADSPISIEQWSPALVKLGISFFVGLSIGFVVKTFLKVSLFFSGIIFLALFGLSYFNIVEVKWEILDTLYQSIVSSLGSQLSAFKSFISGSLPSAGSFGFGLFAAFKWR